MNNAPTPVLIVGAGPAGLAVAGRLEERGVDYEIVERGTQAGESWHHHYDRLHLHTVRDLSHLPGAPFPKSYPQYIPRAQLAEYYVDYAAQRGIEPRFETTVTGLERVGEEWSVDLASPESTGALTARHVIIATGVNRVPHRPALTGEADFGGTVLHSREYRRADPFQGQRVLVVGMGNTGAEIALDLCEQGVSVALSVRGPVNAVPRDVLGRPTHLTALMLGRLPDWLAGPIGSILRRLTVGDLTRYGIATPTIPPIAQLKQFAKTPVVDVGTIKRIKRGDIAVFPGIDRLTSETVHFIDGREGPFDAVILATGYRPALEELLGPCDDLLDANGFPKDPIGAGRWEGLYFPGFDNYQPGGVLGTIYKQSALIADRIAAAKVPS